LPSSALDLLLVSSMTALDTKIMGELAASLERAVWVALRPPVSRCHSSSSKSTYAIVSLSLLMLMSCMSALSTELLG
jgi:hypothetical protein